MHKAATSVACAPPQVEMDVRKLLGLLVVLLHSSGCGAGAFYGFESSSGPSFYGMYGAAGSRSGSQTSFHLPHHYDVEKRLGSTSSSREPLRQVSFPPAPRAKQPLPPPLPTLRTSSGDVHIRYRLQAHRAQSNHRIFCFGLKSDEGWDYC